MAFKLFNKNKKQLKPEKPVEVLDVPEVKKEIPAPAFGGRSVLKSFYVSEKAGHLHGLNQYMFEVERTANKQEIKKSVEQAYKVEVTKIRVQNMPSKSRTVGRYTGKRAGFRKAIVSIKEGQSIEAAKA
jgi:large subunit ribosomal protein L23